MRGTDVADATCVADDCDTPVLVKSRGMCSRHYARWIRRQKADKAIYPDPCRSCGRDVARSAGRGIPKAYCSDECLPHCAVDGCEKKAACRGMCPMHYQRWRQTGDVGESAPTRVKHAGEACAVKGCGQPRRKRDWCGSHYVQWQSTGEVKPFAFKWSRAETCCVCGKPTGKVPGLKKYCSYACHMNWRNHNGQVPAFVECVHCGKRMDLTKGKGGKRLRSDIKQCKRCKNDMLKHGMSVEQLAQRDGTDCGICGKPVDMALRFPDMMRASVDHKHPRARGGTNDPENLQLAHLLCNMIKSDRVTEAV